MTSTIQNATGLDMEHMEVLKKSYDDFEKRQEAESYGVAAPHPGHLVSILTVLPVIVRLLRIQTCGLDALK